MLYLSQKLLLLSLFFLHKNPFALRCTRFAALLREKLVNCSTPLHVLADFDDFVAEITIIFGVFNSLFLFFNKKPSSRQLGDYCANYGSLFFGVHFCFVFVAISLLFCF